MRRLTVVMAVGLTVILSTGIVVAASDKTVRTEGDNKLVPNSMVQSTLRFTPGSIMVNSGDEVTWLHDDRTTEPHTITIVDESALPDVFEEVFACPACAAALGGHFPGGPPVPVLNVGAAGLDTAGDSLLIFDDQSVTAPVSAPSGARLAYLCAIHSWMQGEISVR